MAYKSSLRFNPSKCVIKSDEIVYFRNVLGHSGVKLDPKKLKAMQDLQYPKDKTELQSFLGMVNFLTWFVPHVSERTVE